ncbi:AEC family transporter [Pseudohongiella spirulinae]|uniref:Malate permease n=1 Tax=Pseudohongiella spirulinae TaxID=1249552 RepID=A0A0S2KE80_9GAMM|nr:AEC family transporter [Pseudohongiella spirulinae]ALO46537.1 Malate permease [Pseudohongiella spirulinae]
MSNFFLVLIYLVIGALLRRTALMPDNAASVLNAYVLYVAFPALILKSLPGLQFSFDLLIPALTPWILLAFSVLLVLRLSRWLHWSREQTGALLILVPLGNTSFLGYPLVEAFFGADAIPYALVYDQMGSFLALTIYATIIAAIYSPALSTPDAVSVIRKIITFPSFVALIVGLLLFNVEKPALAISAIDNIAATLVPVVMVAVGFQLSLRFDTREVSPLLVALSLKLLLLPVLAWSMWSLAGQSGQAVDITIFQAAMPSMISAGAVASMAGLSPRLVSGVTGLGILCSLVTLPLVYWLITNVA